MNTFSDPKKIIDQCTINAGQHIADFGAGTGAYTLAIAEKIQGDIESSIFAVDVQKDLLSRLDTEARERHLSGVRVIWGDIENPSGSRLKTGSIDTVLIANTLFQVEDAQQVLTEAQRVLRPKGQMLVVDWSESFGNIGPATEDIITESVVRSRCEDLGFTFEKNIDAGEHHYGLIMRNQ
ncbi:MAG: ubiquinone/menaquinone biosynthesis C-methylase UbiE [Candidatus Paceibacteria bacterium]|jgi:ubiquinone/menaquinone biosynthesis C-methylase UbiE